MEQSCLATALSEALPYIVHFRGKTIVVKIGGSTLGSHDTTIDDVVTLQRLGVNVVLVHGGGSAISNWLRRIGKQPEFVDGLRVTDDETMELVLMILGGKVNKELVADIQARGGRAMGISGLDGGLLRASQRDERLGAVGEVSSVDLTGLNALTNTGFIPVIAPIALGHNNEPLNLNADTAAAEVAVALKAEKIVFLTDTAGVRGADGEIIAQLDGAMVRELIGSGVISGGMIPKVMACIRALDGAQKSHIIDGRAPNALIRELFTEQGVGTMIVRDSSHTTGAARE